MKKYFIYLFFVILCSCDSMHKYVIYNNYKDNIAVEVERKFGNGEVVTEKQNLNFSEEFKELFLAHSLKIKENYLPIKINIFSQGKLYLSYDKKWLVNELKRNNLYGKSYVLLILDENGLHPISNKEYQVKYNNIR